MRIALDGQLAVGTATGIGEYVRGLSNALQEAGVDVRVLDWPRLDPWRFDRRVLWDQAILPARAASSRADLLHCASGTMPLLCSLPMVVTVHDVAWLRAQAHTRSYARGYFGAFSLARYRKARRVMVDSHFSREEFLDVCNIDPQRIDVIYPGVAQDIMQIERRPDAVPFILAVGTVERRKNLESVIRALPALGSVQLISVGPFTPYRAHCEEVARECGVSERLAFRGYVARAELLDLYSRAAAAVVPSTYEGFGYALAQALCAGLPVVAAGSSSLPEVGGSDALYVDAHDVAGWAKALTAVLHDTESFTSRADHARRAATLRFSWQTAATAALKSYSLALTVDSCGGARGERGR